MTNPCPENDDLVRLAQGQVDETTADEIFNHIESCDRCSSIFDAAMQMEKPSSQSSHAGVSEAAIDGALRWAQELELSGQLESVARQSDSTVLGTPSKMAPIPQGDFGEYYLVEEVARGGMGVVYKARHRKLDRIVAVKMVLSGNLASTDEVKRFYDEAGAAANLDHPAIVPVYEVGEVGGQHFYAMGFVDGHNLQDDLARRLPSPREAATLLERLADALNYAHGKGVIHRDLKPSNVMLDELGRPRITDFGLAKRTDRDTQLTFSGQIMGTPSYMPPEQARGERVDARADIYSLGAILYAMLTSRPPFQAASLGETLKLVLDSDVVSPRVFNRNIPIDLETICLKCLERNPSRRYMSAEELQEDLQRFLEGRPIHARRTSVVEKCWRIAVRYPIVSALIVLVVLVAALGVHAVLRESAKVSNARDVAELRLAESQESEYFSWISQTASYYELSDLPAMRQSLASARPSADEPDRRNWEWRFLKRLSESSLRSFDAGTWSFSAAFGPNDKLLATGGGSPHFFSTKPDSPGTLRLWEIETGKLVREFSCSPPHKGIRAIAFHPEGRQLATCEMNWQGGRAPKVPGPVRIWEVKSGRLVQTLDFNERGYKIAFSHDGEYLAVAYSRRGKQSVGLVLWKRGEQGFEIADDVPDEFAHMVPSVSDDVLSVDEGIEEVFDATNFYAPKTNSQQTMWVDSILGLRGLGFYNRQFRQDLTLFAQEGLIHAFDFHPDGRQIAYADSRPMVNFHNLVIGERERVFRGHDETILFVDFNRNGNLMVTGSWDGQVRLWNANKHPQFRSFRALDFGAAETSINALAFESKGRLLGVRANGGQLVRIDPKTGIEFDHRVIQVERDPYGRYGYVAVSEDGRAMVTRDPENVERLNIWDLRTLNLVRHLDAPGEGYLRQLAISDRGRFVAALGGDSENKFRTIVWDLMSGNDEPTFHRPMDSEPLVSFEFDREEYLLLALPSGGDEHGAQLTYVPLNGASEFSWRVGVPAALAANDDGSKVIIVADSKLQCWSVSKRKLLFESETPEPIETVRFFSDDTRIVGASRQSTVLWDAKMGRQILVLRGPKRSYDRPFTPIVRVSPDNNFIATNQWDDVVYIWDGRPVERRKPLPPTEAVEQINYFELRPRRDVPLSTKLHFAESLIRLEPNSGRAQLRWAGLLAQGGRGAEYRKAMRDAARFYQVENLAMLVPATKTPFLEFPQIDFHSLAELTLEAWVQDFSGPIVAQGGSGDPENSVYMDLGVHGFGWEAGEGSNFEMPIGPYLGPGWHHIALTFDGTIQRSFVDGMLVHSQRCPKPGRSKRGRSFLVGNHAKEELFGHGLLRSLRVSKKARYTTEDFDPQIEWPVDDDSILQLDFTKADDGELTNLARRDDPKVTVHRWWTEE